MHKFRIHGKLVPGNHLAAAIGNRLLKDGQTVIVVTVADVMSALYASYDDGQSGEKFLRELCEVDLLVLDEIGIQRGRKTSRWYCTRLLIVGQRRCAAWNADKPEL
ncbi:hypothetical protein ECZC10_54560 [Escherichia coli]|nr:hypothetical protein ECZC10_54560 [Escherichia coli]